jgi:hypothetical protein
MKRIAAGLGALLIAIGAALAAPNDKGAGSQPAPERRIDANKAAAPPAAATRAHAAAAPARRPKVPRFRPGKETR